jgi:hypothetical protein
MTVDQMLSADGVVRQPVATDPPLSSTFEMLSSSRSHCGPSTPDNDKNTFTHPTATAQRRLPIVSQLNDHRHWSQLHHHHEHRFHLTPSCVAQVNERNRRQPYDYRSFDAGSEKTASDGHNANGITSQQSISKQGSNRFLPPMAGVATYLAAANLPSTFPSASSSFSVLDLERAMNRHLPPPSGHSDAGNGDIAPVVGGHVARPDHLHHHYQQPTVWSVCWMTGASLPPPPGHVTANAEHRGPSSASSSSSSSAQLLPASSLLRSLHDAAISRYRRDTVIRSTGTAYQLAPSMRHQPQPLHDKGRIRQRSLAAADDDGCAAGFGTPHGGGLLLAPDDSASKTDETRDCGMDVELGAVDDAFHSAAGPAICGDFRLEAQDTHSGDRGDDDDDPATYAIEEEDVDTMWLHLAAAVVPYHMTSNWNDVIAK